MNNNDILLALNGGPKKQGIVAKMKLHKVKTALIVVAVIVLVFIIYTYMSSDVKTGQCNLVGHQVSSSVCGAIELDGVAECKDADEVVMTATQLGVAPAHASAPCDDDGEEKIALVRLCVKPPYPEILAEAQSGVERPFGLGHMVVLNFTKGTCVWSAADDDGGIPTNAVCAKWVSDADIHTAPENAYVLDASNSGIRVVARLNQPPISLDFMTYATLKTDGNVSVCAPTDAGDGNELDVSGICMKGQRGYNDKFPCEVINTGFAPFTDGKCAAMISFRSGHNGEHKLLTYERERDSEVGGQIPCALFPEYANQPKGGVPPMVQFVTTTRAEIKCYALRITMDGAMFYLTCTNESPPSPVPCQVKYETGTLPNGIVTPLIDSVGFGHSKTCAALSSERPYCFEEKCQATQCKVSGDCNSLADRYGIGMACIGGTCTNLGGGEGFVSQPSQAASKKGPTGIVKRIDDEGIERNVYTHGSMYQKGATPCWGNASGAKPSKNRDASICTAGYQNDGQCQTGWCAGGERTSTFTMRCGPKNYRCGHARSMKPDLDLNHAMVEWKKKNMSQQQHSELKDLSRTATETETETDTETDPHVPFSKRFSVLP
jgi:hypothetical protein